MAKSSPAMTVLDGLVRHLRAMARAAGRAGRVSAGAVPRSALDRRGPVRRVADRAALADRTNGGSFGGLFGEDAGDRVFRYLPNRFSRARQRDGGRAVRLQREQYK
jgi:hypothetical protein